MTWRPAIVLPLILAFVTSCSSEGGSRGSGISTTVRGNIQSMQMPIDGIGVAVEGSTIRTQTDAQGTFSLLGDFDGDISVVFQLPDDGAARIALNVPAAGTL